MHASHPKLAVEANERGEREWITQKNKDKEPRQL